jgi:hypothetical protein
VAASRVNRGGVEERQVSEQRRQLRVVKIAHTVVWVFFASCVVGIPVAAARHEFRAASALIACVAAETLVLLFNRMRCPLTDVAARYTTDRRDNFDIYLPEWLARYNKHIFGSLYVVGIVWTLIAWLRARSA